MTFYDSLGMFLVIFGDFGFFRFLCTRARPRASSYIFETTENHTPNHPKLPKRPQKNHIFFPADKKNAENLKKIKNLKKI